MQREPERHGVHAEEPLQELHGWDGAPRLVKQGRPARGPLQCGRRHADRVRVPRERVGHALPAKGLQVNGAAFWAEPLDVAAELPQYVTRRLSWDEAARELRMRLRRQHGLQALAREAPPHADHLEGWPQPAALQGREPRLPDRLVGRELGPLRLLIQRERGYVRCIELRRVRHALVEPLDCHAAIPRVEASQQLRERVFCVLDAPAVRPGVHVGGRRPHAERRRDLSPHADLDPRHILRDLPAVRAEGIVAGEQLRVCLKEGLQVGAQELLLPLKEDLDIDRQLGAASLKHNLERMDDRKYALFVVGNPSTPKNLRSFIQNWLERRCLPQFNGVGWLDIIMRVQQNGWPGVACVQEVCVDDRLSRSIQFSRVLHSGTLEPVDKPVGTSFDICGVLC
mmetsp:Transcript_33676/g.79915  ORF Transcript_33676/g.79915 Transcript_33676/m.79915 type:complete len:397 (+) Transcript_33676:272-1462(+)